MAEEKTTPSVSEVQAALTTLFSEGGPLSEIKPGFSHRPEQLDFALAAARAFAEGGILLADAPTGTGKSVAYLAAAILSGQRAIVSTATIALQNQLLAEDLPVLRKAVCRLTGYPEDEGFTFAVMKGRPNFLCHQRHEETLRDGRLLSGDLVRELDLWRSRTETGDREDLSVPVPAPVWAEVASDGEDCAPKACAFREGCFYYAHRERAAEADVIVVNHALLLANCAADGNIFDPADRRLVLDEAHRVEEIMSDALGARVSYGRVRYAMRQARKKSDGASHPADRAEMAAELFFGDLRENAVLGDVGAAPRSYAALLDSLVSVREALASDPKEEANNLASMVGRLAGDLGSFYSDLSASHAHAVVPGFSRDPTRQPYPELKSWLVETGDAFRQVVLPLFTGGVVLCSATLAEGTRRPESPPARSFAYVRRRLGLNVEDGQRVAEHAGAEVFDYANKALLYLADDLPDPTSAGAAVFDRACVDRVDELVSLSEGRALILLSTGRAVRAFRENFRPPFPVRFQGDDAPGRLVRWLRETESAVLVGTRTFWEGVDVSGDALVLVVLDRVPFAPPGDPVFEALKAKAGRAWFRELSLPKARVAMRQGAGRLIRSATDRGVIAVLDPRLGTKSWGAAVFSSLPPAPVTTKLSEVRRFFAG